MIYPIFDEIIRSMMIIKQSKSNIVLDGKKINIQLIKKEDINNDYKKIIFDSSNKYFIIIKYEDQ